MKKLFKLIATVTLSVAMLLTTSLPAMASELPDKEVKAENVEIQSRARITSFTYNGNITLNKKLGTVYVASRAKTVKYSVKGNGGNVMIRMKNKNTGDSRSFTSVGDGRWSSITYVSYMDPGTWEISAEFITSGTTHNGLTLEFYS